MNSVNIYLEANPNPNSLKFVADRMLLDDKIIKDYKVDMIFHAAAYKHVNILEENIFSAVS